MTSLGLRRNIMHFVNFSLVLMALRVLQSNGQDVQDCYNDWDNGESYRGVGSTTVSGFNCQNWTAQTPHEHTRTPENYPFAGLENNYCRNPDLDDRPWCYTTERTRRWEYCDIPICSEETTAQPVTPSSTIVIETSSITSSVTMATTKESSAIPAVDPSDCYNVKDDGASYRGAIATSESGYPCQKWVEQSPHKHSRTPVNFPEAGLDNNYCRNPDNEERPWCYTTNPKRRWQYCNVPQCIDISSTTTVSATSTTTETPTMTERSASTTTETPIPTMTERSASTTTETPTPTMTERSASTTTETPTPTMTERSASTTTETPTPTMTERSASTTTETPTPTMTERSASTTTETPTPTTTERSASITTRTSTLVVTEKSTLSTPGKSTSTTPQSLSPDVEASRSPMGSVSSTTEFEPVTLETTTVVDVEPTEQTETIKSTTEKNRPCESNPCHVNATCLQNGDSSYSCQCSVGLRGDGVKLCRPPIPCEDTPCHPKGICYPVGDEFRCQCRPEYEGDGTFCRIVNRCRTAPCHRDAICQHRADGGLVCICRAGYQGDGKRCRKIDPCNGISCQTNARCIRDDRAQQGYRCECINGKVYYDDGRSWCVGRLGRYVCDLCNDNAKCFLRVPTFGKVFYDCKCNAGYKGDGKRICRKILPCDSAKCPRNTKCVNENETHFHCQCTSGYTGTGPSCSVASKKCELYIWQRHMTPSYCKLNPCHNYRCPKLATCRNTWLGPVCSCMSGYTRCRSGCVDNRLLTFRSIAQYLPCWKVLLI